MSASRIAFLGTGLMGLPMAKNLLAAGHSIAAWNRTRARVHDGDMIEVDVETRTSRLCVADAELERRRAARTPPAPASD